MLDLLFVAGRSIDEIRTQTGMSPATIYQWRSRLKQAFREKRASLLANGTPANQPASSPP